MANNGLLCLLGHRPKCMMKMQIAVKWPQLDSGVWWGVDQKSYPRWGIVYCSVSPICQKYFLPKAHPWEHSLVIHQHHFFAACSVSPMCQKYFLPKPHPCEHSLVIHRDHFFAACTVMNPHMWKVPADNLWVFSGAKFVAHRRVRAVTTSLISARCAHICDTFLLIPCLIQIVPPGFNQVNMVNKWLQWYTHWTCNAISTWSLL